MLFVGNLKKEKGVYELLEAFAEIRRNVPHIVLKICGQGIERFGMEKRIEELRISDCVSLIGAVEPAEMHKWMQASDLFVLPTYHEGMPNVVMEAMACGLPVISTTVGGLPEAVGSSGGALLIEPKNIEQLTGTMAGLAGDRARRERMSSAARQTAEQKFGAQANAIKLLGYLSAVIERYKKHGK
jgi:glycosyltransferase involved in cell wall biosynthesis